MRAEDEPSDDLQPSGPKLVPKQLRPVRRDLWCGTQLSQFAGLTAT